MCVKKYFWKPLYLFLYFIALLYRLRLYTINMHACINVPNNKLPLPEWRHSPYSFHELSLNTKYLHYSYATNKGTRIYHSYTLNAIVLYHYDDVIMGAMASQITSLTIVYSTVYSGADQSKHQSSASLAFVRGIHRDRWIPRTNGQ